MHCSLLLPFGKPIIMASPDPFYGCLVPPHRTREPASRSTSTSTSRLRVPAMLVGPLGGRGFIECRSLVVQSMSAAADLVRSIAAQPRNTVIAMDPYDQSAGFMIGVALHIIVELDLQSNACMHAELQALSSISADWSPISSKPLF